MKRHTHLPWRVLARIRPGALRGLETLTERLLAEDDQRLVANLSTFAGGEAAAKYARAINERVEELQELMQERKKAEEPRYATPAEVRVMQKRDRPRGGFATRDQIAFFASRLP